ncbi:MAG: 23S rRNA (uracil(1939)-C(5))-methyltransferase RlmD [Chloroflexi bacterium]|nr:23S rRNA (uracil(1939)-C(5))-methyltransferase RlmD [Chloroflexota bacterium]
MAKNRRKPLDPVDVQLTIEEMAFMGEGLARHGDDLVYVANTIQGEEVIATLRWKSRRYLEAEVKEILKPSPHRVTPPCRYYGECTGCQWQHIAYPHQLELKAKLVADQLRRVGGFTEAIVRPTIGCEEPWAYRNHARFTVRRESGQLGFVHRSRHRFVRIDHCLIMEAGVNRLLGQLQERCGETTQLSIRYGVKTDSFLIQPTLKSDKVTVPTGQKHYEEEMLGRRFRVASPSFFQVNVRQAERLIGVVREALSLTGRETLVDAYAGVGTFAALLAPSARQVIAIEESSSAVADARLNIEGLANVTLAEGKTEEVMAQMAERPDAVILDPPRTGCHKTTLDSLVRLQPPRVAYVSCDPESLARDLKVLCASGYELIEVQPVDMFPHTYHIEAVANLRWRGG